MCTQCTPDPCIGASGVPGVQGGPELLTLRKASARCAPTAEPILVFYTIPNEKQMQSILYSNNITFNSLEDNKRVGFQKLTIIL